MRVETNDRVIKRNRQIAQYSFFVSMGVWLSSMLVTFPGILGDRADTGAFSILEVGLTFALPFALVLALFAIHMTNLWIREPRPEQAIREGLKGVSKKSVLYHYYHSPAKHVLIAPQGVFVLIVRWQQGLIEVDGDKWRQKRSLAARIGGAFRLDNVGDPINESKRAINYLERVLEPITPDVDVQAIVVLTDPTSGGVFASFASRPGERLGMVGSFRGVVWSIVFTESPPETPHTPAPRRGRRKAAPRQNRPTTRASPPRPGACPRPARSGAGR